MIKSPPIFSKPILHTFKRSYYLIFFFLLACGAGPQRKHPDPQVEEVGTPAIETPRTRAIPGNTGGLALKELISEVNFHLGENNLEKAAASAERAIRIAPTSAQAYFALAQVRFYQAQYGLSRSLLYKARSMAVSREMYTAIEKFLARPQYR